MACAVDHHRDLHLWGFRLFGLLEVLCPYTHIASRVSVRATELYPPLAIEVEVLRGIVAQKMQPVTDCIFLILNIDYQLR